MLRKLTDVTSGEDLAAIKALLEARIPVTFYIHSTKEADFYRIYVYIMHLEAARKILAERKKIA
jgi:hypothetical protein